LRHLILVAGVALGCGTAWPSEPVSPEPPPGVAARDAPQAPAAAEKLICKRQKVTGSNIARQKVCRTRAAWAEAAAETRAEMRNQIQRSTSGPQPKGS
jgi:hypothetical protein